MPEAAGDGHSYFKTVLKFQSINKKGIFAFILANIPLQRNACENSLSSPPPSRMHAKIPSAAPPIPKRVPIYHDLSLRKNAI